MMTNDQPSYHLVYPYRQHGHRCDELLRLSLRSMCRFVPGVTGCTVVCRDDERPEWLRAEHHLACEDAPVKGRGHRAHEAWRKYRLFTLAELGDPLSDILCCNDDFVMVASYDGRNHHRGPWRQALRRYRGGYRAVQRETMLTIDRELGVSATDYALHRPLRITREAAAKAVASSPSPRRIGWLSYTGNLCPQYRGETRPDGKRSQRLEVPAGLDCYSCSDRRDAVDLTLRLYGANHIEPCRFETDWLFAGVSSTTQVTVDPARPVV